MSSKKNCKCGGCVQVCHYCPVQGKTGDPGCPGEKGSKGDKGQDGEQGFRGERGDKGATGEPVCPIYTVFLNSAELTNSANDEVIPIDVIDPLALNGPNINFFVGVGTHTAITTLVSFTEAFSTNAVVVPSNVVVIGVVARFLSVINPGVAGTKGPTVQLYYKNANNSSGPIATGITAAPISRNCIDGEDYCVSADCCDYLIPKCSAISIHVDNNINITSLPFSWTSYYLAVTILLQKI